VACALPALIALVKCTLALLKDNLFPVSDLRSFALANLYTKLPLRIMSAPIQPAGAEGFYGSKDHREEGAQDKTGAGILVTHAGNDAGAQANPTLEAVAESKGRWFQYVKTKQFWITLLLGQGRISPSMP
jgi:hypothetical protein